MSVSSLYGVFVCGMQDSILIAIVDDKETAKHIMNSYDITHEADGILVTNAGDYYAKPCTQEEAIDWIKRGVLGYE